MFVSSLQGVDLYKWNQTVSDQCCVSCNGTVVPHDVDLEVTVSQDECGTVKRSSCRKLPGTDNRN